MWNKIKAQIEQNERDHPEPNRQDFYDVIRSSGLRASEGTTTKMVSFKFGTGEILLWEIEGTARNFFLNEGWLSRIEQAGFNVDLRVLDGGLEDAGPRHSDLNRKWSFLDSDCIEIRINSTDDLHRLLGIVLKVEAPLDIKSKAVSRWIARLRLFFPELDQFDKPDPKFDASERDYKLEIARDLSAALERANSDQKIVEAIYAGLSRKESNLLSWRAYWPLSPKGNADRDLLWPALSALVQAATGNPKKHPDALQNFVNSWIQAVPNGTPDHARQIAEFLFMHLCPEHGIYMRHTLRQEFWLEAVGSKFPDHDSMAEAYADELRFMQAVQLAFKERGLAPRDMIDVQSALWVVRNYKDEDMEQSNEDKHLTREAIEGAMDAYDLYLETGENSEVFESFGQPKDFWVRSTRVRSNPVYPSKSIHCLANGQKESSGGWGGPSYSAAALHNAGYIIVDKDDQPVEVPSDKKFLLRDADRIRHCALNYYIAPARERSQARVSIRAGTLNNELMLKEAWPNVCQALKGPKFQKLAHVSVPMQEGPDASTTTTFTFNLQDYRDGQTMNSESEGRLQRATNLILYGPPGTGKTYTTAFEAVRLCLGDEVANALQGSAKRNALMDKYRQLVDEERITFVTFHQSMSYEEFVEGLRPETRDLERQEFAGDAPESGGFRLKIENGIFKEMSIRADQAQRKEVGVQFLDPKRSVYKLAINSDEDKWLPTDELNKKAIDEGLIYWPRGGDIDWSASVYSDFNAIGDRWREDNPGAGGRGADISGTYYFRSALEEGDYVVLTWGKERFLALGQVTGPYEYKVEKGTPRHRRSVKWLWSDWEDGQERTGYFDQKFSAWQPIYEFTDKFVDREALERLLPKNKLVRTNEIKHNYVLIIDEINRANISKVFGELITLLEPEKRLGETNEIRLRLPYSKKLFGVPANLHIIGTMNTADRSIALLDTALRRRFKFRELMPDPTLLSDNVGGVDLQKLLTTINERIEYLFDREHQIGHAYFIGCRTLADIEATMRNEIIPLLAEYFYEDWSKIAVVLEGRPISLENDFDGSFLRNRRLQAPALMGEEDGSRARFRWSVNEQFDFKEFKNA